MTVALTPIVLALLLSPWHVHADAVAIAAKVMSYVPTSVRPPFSSSGAPSSPSRRRQAEQAAETVALLPSSEDHSFHPATPDENLAFLNVGPFGADGRWGTGTLVTLPEGASRRFVVTAGHTFMGQDGAPIHDLRNPDVLTGFQFCLDVCGQCYRTKRVWLPADSYQDGKNARADMAFVELQTDVCPDARIRPAQMVALTRSEVDRMIAARIPVMMAAFYYPSIINTIRRRLEAGGYDAADNQPKGDDPTTNPGEHSVRYISSGRVKGLIGGLVGYELESLPGGSGAGVVFQVKGQSYLFAIHTRAGSATSNLGAMLMDIHVSRFARFVHDAVP